MNVDMYTFSFRHLPIDFLLSIEWLPVNLHTRCLIDATIKLRKQITISFINFSWKEDLRVN